jgi:ribosomal protein L3
MYVPKRKTKMSQIAHSVIMPVFPVTVLYFDILRGYKENEKRTKHKMNITKYWYENNFKSENLINSHIVYSKRKFVHTVYETILQRYL